MTSVKSKQMSFEAYVIRINVFRPKVIEPVFVEMTKDSLKPSKV